MDKTDRLRDYGLAFLLYEHGLGVCGYELIRELFIFIKLILNSYLSLILRPNYLSLSLVYQYISFKPLKTDGMLTDLVRGGALTGGLNTRFLNTNNANLTNIFARGFLSFNRSRISLFYTHTDLYLLIAHGSHSDVGSRGDGQGY